MKKNLKKVISAVIALTVSASSAAFAAPNFSDVADTASYAQAVNTLAALGVIKGYEDGSFKPDNNITRAEVATMVVAALNRTADAEGSKGSTKFADMNTEAKNWATGFVNIGVSEGFISGYEDGSFKPDNNVTFAEMVSMLVRVAGYGRYAEYLGGWPNGYLSVGNDKGVTKGVSAGSDVAVTRGQVAQLIYNTLLDVPTVESTTLTTDSNGNLVPEMTIMDGKGDNEYKTLLTEKHNTYYVEGHVSATNRTNSTKYDADEVEFTIEYTENYDDSDVVIKKGAKDSSGNAITSKESVYVGDTDAANYLFTYATALIKVDDDDDATFVSFTPSGKNTVDSFDASLIDDDDYKTKTVFDADYGKDGKVVDKPYVKYYSAKDASKSTKYSLDKDFELYVNGVAVTANQKNFEKYVVDNQVGKVDLIDRYSASSKADGKYDLIFVTYYATAKVGAVNTNTGRITFNKAYNNDNKMYITLDPNDDDLTYEIIYNGAAIELSALQADDVISIAYDVNNNLDDSDFYEIYVSRDKAEGQYTNKSNEDETVKIGGKDYEFVQKYDDVVSDTGFKMSDEYTIYLDAFGRIFDYETLVSSAKLAVVDKYTKASSDDYYKATLYTADGATKASEVDTSKVTLTIGGKTYKNGDVDTQMKKLVYVDGNSGAKTDIQNRVVKYKISSSTGRITSLEIAGVQKSATDEEFKSSSNSIGNVKMNDATKVIDAISYTEDLKAGKIPTYSDLSTASLSSFANESDYTAFAFGDRNSDGTYPLVIVTDAGGNYTADTRFAVVTKQPSTGVDDATQDDIYTLTALYNGEETNFVVNDDVDVTGAVGSNSDAMLNLQKGDVIVFVKDGKGNIKTIDVIVSASALGVDTSYAKVATNAFDGTATKGISTVGAKNWVTDWNKTTSGADLSKDVTQLVYGPIVEKKNSYFKLGKIVKATGSEGFTDDNGKAISPAYMGMYTDKSKTSGADIQAMEINITSDTKVYVWDYSKTNEKVQLSDGDAGTGAIVATTIANSLLYNNRDVIPWDNEGVKAGVNFAFAKVVDGDATDVFVILAK